MINQGNLGDPLVIALYEFIEEGVGEAFTFFEGKGASPDPWLFPHIVRWSICRRLDELHGTNVSYERVDLPNSGVEVRIDGQRLRVFKATPDGELPAPGRSLARQDFYNGNLFGTDEEIFGTANLVIMWEVDAAYNLVNIQLVCPTQEGSAYRPGQQRWAITLPHPATLQPSPTNLTDASDLNIGGMDPDDGNDLDIQEGGSAGA